MEGPGDTKNRSEGGENHQTATVINSINNEGEVHGQEVENESEDPMIQERSAELNLETKQIFIVDYCKRGTTKCRRCKKNIAVNELRIGKSIKFNSKNISILPRCMHFQII